MITIKDLVRRVHESKNPRITRIYLPDDEYYAIVEEARVAIDNRLLCGDDLASVRIAPAWAPCFRLADIPIHRLAAEEAGFDA